MKKTAVKIFHYFLLSLLLLSLTVFPIFGQTQIGDFNVEVEQLDLLNLTTPMIPSTKGIITLGYTPEVKPYYVNIVAKDQSEVLQWIVRNLYIPANTFITTPQQISVRFCFGLLGYLPEEVVTKIEMDIIKSEDILISAPKSEKLVAVDVTPLQEDAEGEITEVPPAVPALEEIPPFLEFVEGDNVSEVDYRGCAVPNIDLDDETYSDKPAAYAGDKNACGPAAAANSLKWLTVKYPEITISQTHREVLTELSALMKRAPNNGVTIQQFIQGKLDYIQLHKFQINVKFQSSIVATDVSSSDGMSTARNDNAGSYPTWEWLKKEILAGEDVELMYYWPDEDGWRGHAVVITGFEESPNGRKAIKFKHDLKQSAAGGTKQESDNIVIDSYGRMILLSRGAYVGHVVAESPGDPFPVEMSFFMASVEKNSVHLTWQTLSESNNYGFQIYRNGEKIAFVKGAGTTNQPQAYFYQDCHLTNGLYHYELYQTDFDGTTKKIASQHATISAQPVEFALSQNYPNPFNATTHIKYVIAERSFVTLTIHNLLGETVATLINETQPAGQYEVKFDASRLVSGLYYYRLQSDTHTQMRKFILLK